MNLTKQALREILAVEVAGTEKGVAYASMLRGLWIGAFQKCVS